jgi:hypothetical protein
MNQYIIQIQKEGYCIIPKVYQDWQVEYLLLLVKKYHEETKDNICQDAPRLNKEQPNLYNLQNKDISFLQALLRQSVDLEKILVNFLNDKWYKQIPNDQPNYILRSFGARSSKEALPLHIDSFIPYQGDEVIAMQVAICLEDQSEQNGCTVVVPGSHKTGKYAESEYIKYAIPLTPKAGDIVIWDSRLWHGTTKNNTENTRWAVIATFCRWWIKQHFNITESLPKEIYNQLLPKEKAILGFASISPKDEYEAIDMKKGYDKL